MGLGVGLVWAWGLASVCGLGLVVGSSGLNVGFLGLRLRVCEGFGPN